VGFICCKVDKEQREVEIRVVAFFLIFILNFYLMAIMEDHFLFMTKKAINE